MRKVFTLFTCLLGTLTSFSQGYLNFANIGTGVNSQFRDINGVPLSGPGYMVEMLAGATAATTSLTPIFAGSFSSGYFNGGSITVPASAIGGAGTSVVLLRVWDSVGGAFTTYDAAVAGIAWHCSTTEFTVTPQTSTTLPPTPLTGMPFLNCIPEPSILALAALGLGALMIRRRK